MNLKLTLINPRERMRELAEEWASLRKAIRRCSGEYFGCAILREQLRLTEKVWKDCRHSWRLGRRVDK